VKITASNLVAFCVSRLEIGEFGFYFVLVDRFKLRRRHGTGLTRTRCGRQCADGVIDGSSALALVRHCHNPGHRQVLVPRRHLPARLAAVLVVPEALTRLERLAAKRAAVRPYVRVDPLVRAYGRRILEPFPADTTRLIQRRGMLEQFVLLEVIALLESDRADPADVGPIIGVRADVVLVRRVLRKRLPADVAGPIRL